jgi:hypothetical protein
MLKRLKLAAWVIFVLSYALLWVRSINTQRLLRTDEIAINQAIGWSKAALTIATDALHTAENKQLTPPIKKKEHHP